MTSRHLLIGAVVTSLLAVGFPSSAAAQAAPASKPTPAQAAAQQVPPEIDTAFQAWDVDHNGTLSLQEFRNGWLALRRTAEMQARLREQFHKLDANGNDALEANEYANLVLVKQAGKSAPPLSAFDTNKNQRLEFGEYVELIRRLAAQPSAPATKP
jgi:Ca2+-binding EF-hand superfamily protein